MKLLSKSTSKAFFKHMYKCLFLMFLRYDVAVRIIIRKTLKEAVH